MMFGKYEGKRVANDFASEQYVFRTTNDYGASIITGGIAYAKDGTWELAVIQWKGNSFDIVYDTPITEDVLGGLTPSEVVSVLERIETL